ncbi:MAG: hypothetical protein ACI8TP_002637 [Acidimicrobiales bacterium]|jgi:hypothetical protein
MVVIESAPPANEAVAATTDREKRGRKWLLVSFLFCPCHLPVIMTVLGVLFGGSAFGALVGRNTIGEGVVFGAIYAILLVIGFRHLRSATKDVDCTDGECTLPA